MLHGRHAFRHQLVRVLVAQLVEAERAALGDLYGSREQVGVLGEAAGDFVERPQVPLGVGKEAPACLGERALRADARQHVLEVAALGHVVMHVVGGDERDAGTRGQLGELREAGSVGQVIRQFGGEVETVGEDGFISDKRRSDPSAALRAGSATQRRRDGGTKRRSHGETER